MSQSRYTHFAGEPKKESYFNSVNCAYAKGGILPCSQKSQRSEMYHDPSGYYWCKEHQYRGELLQWAYDHGYPAIQFMGKMYHAIGYHGATSNDTIQLWETAVLLGSDDMVQAALTYVQLTT